MFVFAHYKGLSFSDVKLLTTENSIKGIDGDYWIFTQREKNEQPIKVSIPKNAIVILYTNKDCAERAKGKLLPV